MAARPDAMTPSIDRDALDGKRVCIVMLSAIGDVVHVLPVIGSLRAAYPSVHITWVIQPAGHELVKDHPAVDEFIVFDRRAGVRGVRDLYRATRGRSFDLVLGLQVYLKAGLIVKMLKAPRKLGFDRRRARDLNWLFTTERIPARGQRHVQAQYFEFLEHLGVPIVEEWGFGTTDDERARYAGLLPASDRPTVALVVGTSKAEKEWPVDRYALLIDRLDTELGARSVLVGACSERETRAAEAVSRAAATPPLDLRAWDLRRLVYLLERVDCLVSPDTGPLHMAIALGTPTVGLFGYTNPKRVGPYSRFRDLLVDAYGDEGEEYPVSAEYRQDRMGRITVDEVVEKVRLALARYPRSSPRGQPGP